MLEVGWTDNADAATYDVVLSGDGSFQGPTTSQGGGPNSISVPLDLIALGSGSSGGELTFRAAITAKRTDGATVATCATADAIVPGPGAPTIVGKPVAITAGGLLTVNYSVPDSPFVQGIEYRLDNGPWLRPGGQAPLNGVGGAFSLTGLVARQATLTLRTVTTDPNVVLEGTPTTVAFPSTPSGKPPASSGVATGSNPTAPTTTPPAAPVSSVPGTSNGAGTGTNGALAAITGDAGIDAPCLAEDGTLYPTLYSTVGSQLTMAPNTRGMGAPASFTVVAGALPAGMQLDRRVGVVYGVTTQVGSWTTTVRARFADGTTKDSQFTTRVDADPQTLQHAAQNIGSVGRSLSVAATTNAPVTGTTYTLVCGTLPKGTRLDANTGRILGTPTAVVTRPVPLRIAETSSVGTAAASFIVVVDRAGTSRLSYPAHPHARTGHRITIRPTVSGIGDVAEYRTWKGKLPRGLRLNHQTGVITGRVTRPGPTHTITLVAETKGGALMTAAPMRIRIGR